ncbi:MAG TPA: DMT family transporter [Candidatus Limnocylindrales bacterium]|nr:DMT family transporter [Candidatus Limnocylindrales bacterium]
MKESNSVKTVSEQVGKSSKLPGWLVVFAFAAMVVLFGVRFIAIPVSNSGLDPFWGGALRLVLASLILLFVAFVRRPAFPNMRGLLFSLIYGFFSIGLNIGLLYWGLLQVNSDTASIVYAAVPLAAVLLAVCFGLEAFRVRLLAGALLGLFGVVVIFGVAVGYGASVVSLLAIVGGAFFSSVGMIAAKKAQAVDPIVMNCVGFALGASMLFSMSLLTGETIALPAQELTWLAIGCLVAVSVVGYSINVFVIQQRSVSYASFSNVLTPIVTIVASSFMFGEVITPAFIAGSGLIFAGLFFSGHVVFKKSE